MLIEDCACPCRRCQSRTADCHGKCERYRNWRGQYAADWQQYKTEKRRECEYIEYRNEVFRRHNTGADRKDRRR